MTDKQVNKTTEALKLSEEALNAMLTHMGMDEDEWTKPTFNQAREALAAIREALAEQPLLEPEGRCKECMAYNDHLDYCSKAKPVKQEPVAIVKYFDIVPLQASMCLEPDTLLYAAPVGADHFLKAIAALREGIATCRAEALDEAAKWFEDEEHPLQPKKVAAAIRGLK